MLDSTSPASAGTMNEQQRELEQVDIKVENSDISEADKTLNDIIMEQTNDEDEEKQEIKVI